jgi:hypothetical protein
VLDDLQESPEAALVAQADRARGTVERCYTFERMTNTVVSTIERLLAERRESVPRARA